MVKVEELGTLKKLVNSTWGKKKKRKHVLCFLYAGGHFHDESLQKPYDGGTILILISYTNQLRFREVSSLAQGHTAQKW